MQKNARSQKRQRNKSDLHAKPIFYQFNRSVQKQEMLQSKILLETFLVSTYLAEILSFAWAKSFISAKRSFTRDPNSPKYISDLDSHRKHFIWYIRITSWDRLAAMLDFDSQEDIYFLQNHYSAYIFFKINLTACKFSEIWTAGKVALVSHTRKLQARVHTHTHTHTHTHRWFTRKSCQLKQDPGPDDLSHSVAREDRPCWQLASKTLACVGVVWLQICFVQRLLSEQHFSFSHACGRISCHSLSRYAKE